MEVVSFQVVLNLVRGREFAPGVTQLKGRGKNSGTWGFAAQDLEDAEQKPKPKGVEKENPGK